MVKRAGNNFSASLSKAIMNHNDLATVKAAAPSYMLILDSFVSNTPDDPQTLVSAAQLYSSYAGLFTQDKVRAERLSARAYAYALQALCFEEKALCGADKLTFDVYEAGLLSWKNPNLDILFAAGSVWAGWIQTHSTDWAAVAQLPKVKAIMRRVIAQDGAYALGQAHMYMGVLEALLPPSAGGDLSKAKIHFEKAIKLADYKNLMAKVLYAKNYARMIFDQELHDQLLGDVLAADAQADQLTLMNMAAQEEAADLLEESDDYFL